MPEIFDVEYGLRSAIHPAAERHPPITTTGMPIRVRHLADLRRPQGVTTMSASALREAAPPALARSSRKVVHRTRGRGHGPIVRLMSPSDLGEHLKPFVFLDLFEADMRAMSRGMSIHPHSGIATVTDVPEGHGIS
jgi:hypothetical protein